MAAAASDRLGYAPHLRRGVAFAAGLVLVVAVGVTAQMLAVQSVGLGRALVVVGEGSWPTLLFGLPLLLALCQLADDHHVVADAAQVRVRCLAATAIALVFGVLAEPALRWAAGPLTELTLTVVGTAVRLVWSDGTFDAGLRLVGTPAFEVRIEPACSGIEGVALILALTTTWVWLERKHLRFPRALWILVFAALASLAANVVRIFALVAIGQRDPILAITGFHANAGWFFLSATFFVVVPMSEHLLSARKGSDAPVALAAGDVLAVRRLLLPLVASMSVALLVRMAGLDETPYMSLRYLGAVLAMVLVGVPGDLVRRVPAGAALAGLGVAAGWAMAASGGGLEPALSPVQALGFIAITPAIEELAFRGYLMRRLVRRDIEAVGYSSVSWSAMVLSSVAFGAMHGDALLGAAAGLVFGLCARRWGLSGATTAHVAANAGLVAFAAATGEWGAVG